MTKTMDGTAQGTTLRLPRGYPTAPPTTAEDVKELSEVQQRILLHAAAAVKPGGKLVYAACTLADLETTGVVQAFEQLCSQFERLSVSNPLVSGAPPSKQLFLWPQESGGNGMCVASWVRTSV